MAKQKQNPIIAFTYYANNFHYDFIDRVWKDNPALKEHLKGKWDILVTQLTKARKESNNSLIRNMSGTELFYQFYMMLDTSNKELLNEFILKQ
tara:strand:+ start:772 stop:1050 length:279 start_codon:yes stop_codon:yes gene_type:complete